MQEWKNNKDSNRIKEYVVCTDLCEMCPLPIHHTNFTYQLRTGREKNRQTAL